MRSCVGCGERAAQGSLLRMTWREGVLRRDGGVRGAGRGGYLHDRRVCWNAFVARRGPVRSLRAAVPRAAREVFVHELSGLAPGREG